MLICQAKAQDQVILQSSEPAPFQGVLVPESTYRVLWANTRKKNDLETELQSCLNTKYTDQDADEKADLPRGVWGGVGFVSGILTVLLISHAAK